MTLLEALVLGLVQGVTEFLPVSSSGHLVLAERLFHISFDDISFEVAVHFATILAVAAYFLRSLARVFLSPFRMLAREPSDSTRRGFRLFIAVCVGTVPAILLGLPLRDRIESAFSSALLVSILLLVTSAVVLSTRFAVNRSVSIGAGRGFVIGCAQAVAMLPGVSRSGATIASALFCGVDRKESFDFSFMLSLPAVVGASLLSLMDMMEAGMPAGAASYLTGMVAAFVSGYFSLGVLRRLVVSGRFHLFGFYTLIVGLLGIIFLA